MSSAKWRPVCLGLNVLTTELLITKNKGNRGVEGIGLVYHISGLNILLDHELIMKTNQITKAHLWRNASVS